MKISKLLPVLCALAAGATCFTVRAEDNPAQAAARAALANQLFELNGQPSAAVNSVDTNVVMTPANTKENSKEAKAKARAEKAAAEAKAKQDADKKLAEQQAAQTKAKTEQTAAAAAMPAPDQQAEAQKAAMAQFLAAGGMTNNMAQATTNAPPAKAKLEAKAKKEKKQKAAQASGNATPKTDENYAGKELGMQPVAAPPPPISASKVEKLQALLAKYRADQISPEEYQRQRAAIIADP